MNKLKRADGFKNQYLFVIPEDFLACHEKNSLLSSFMISDIGFFPAAQYHYRTRPSGCEEGILLICVAGKGYCHLENGDKIEITANQAFLLPPLLNHQYGADEKNPWSVYWLHFKGENLHEICKLILSLNQPVHIEQEQLDEVIHLFATCFEILKKPCQLEEYFAVCQHALAAVSRTILAGKNANLTLTKKGGEGMQEAILFMKQNLTNTITLAQIADAIGFSVSHLHALFKSSTGYSPVNYYLQMKMQAAGKELFFTNKSVKEIAYQFGIFDSCYFSRLFKKIMGMSPIAYRNIKKG